MPGQQPYWQTRKNANAGGLSRLPPLGWLARQERKNGCKAKQGRNNTECANEYSCKESAKAREAVLPDNFATGRGFVKRSGELQRGQPKGQGAGCLNEPDLSALHASTDGRCVHSRQKALSDEATQSICGLLDRQGALKNGFVTIEKEDRPE
jgi:hypothetical protein